MMKLGIFLLVGGSIIFNTAIADQPSLTELDRKDSNSIVAKVTESIIKNTLASAIISVKFDSAEEKTVTGIPGLKAFRVKMTAQQIGKIEIPVSLGSNELSPAISIGKNQLDVLVSITEKGGTIKFVDRKTSKTMPLELGVSGPVSVKLYVHDIELKNVVTEDLIRFEGKTTADQQAINMGSNSSDPLSIVKQDLSFAVKFDRTTRKTSLELSLGE